MRQTHKRLLSLLLAVCMVVSLLPAGIVSAAEEEDPDTPAAGTVIYSETFDTLPDDLASTLGWELVKLQDGYALKGTTAADAGLLGTFTSLGQLNTPYTIVVDMMMLDALSSKGFSAGLTFGKTSDDTYYHYRMDNGNGQHAQLYQWSSGSVNKKLFSSEYSMTVEANIPFRLRVTYDGTTITCYTNGTQTYTIDRAVDAGYAGLRIYNTIAYVDNLTIYSGVVEPPTEGDTPSSFALPEGETTVWNNEDSGYTESDGTWSDVAEAGQDGSSARKAEGGSASFSSYPPDTGNFKVSYYLPAADSSEVEVTITTLDGMWKYTIPAESAAGWYQLGTVSATAGTAFTLSASSEGTIYADAVKLVQTQDTADKVYTPTSGGSDEAAVLVNQIGYDYGSSKRATVPNVENGTEFKVINSTTGETAYTGKVQDNIADFTELDTVVDTDFYITCAGAQSYVFTIGEDVIQRRSVVSALAFMNEVRSDTFCVGHNSIAWRDSHQFSFELNGLVLQYMANPSLYDSMEYGIVSADTCEYEELRVQDEPDIIWLMQFAALRYYDWGCVEGKNLHMLTKEQLAYFLYIYPQISQYVSEETYEAIRDYTISVWGVDACNVEWYAVSGTNHDLYSLQTVFGGLKGSQPPGHSIVPNLLMYEVAMRDGLGDDVAQKFFDAAYTNCAWLISDEFDLNDPFYNKGQRMSEYITIPALSYFLEVYPDQAPDGLEEALQNWATTTIARSNNMWDIRMAVCEAAGDFQYYFHNPSMQEQHLYEEYWTGAAYANADKQSEYLSGGAPRNEPGNQAGLQAVTYAAARVLDDDDTVERLKELGVAAIDDLFGRNPTGRAAFYNFTRDFEGGDLGWYKQFSGGAGVLEGRTGVIDANAPESCYPYNPENYNTGYTEGWIAYNTAWNASLAYSAADSVSLSVSAASGKIGDKITITLHAPINLDNTVQETGYVWVTNLLTGEQEKVSVTESGTSSSTLTAEYTLPNTCAIQVSYGYGLFENTAEVEIIDFESDPLTSVTVTPAESVLAIGESVTLNAEIMPADANDQRLTWTSSDDSIAVVEGGKVTAVSKGTVTITATGWDGTTKGSAQVTVIAAKAKALLISAPETVSILSGSEKAEVTGVLMTNGDTITENLPQATFSSADPEIAKVTEDGTITGVSAGETTITATAVVDGVTVTGQVKITVTASKTTDLLALYRAEAYTNSGVTLVVATPTKDALSGTYGYDRLKLTGGAAGNSVGFELGQIAPGAYEVMLYTKFYGGDWAYGTWSFQVNGQSVGSAICFNDSEKNGNYHEITLGQVVLTGGDTVFTFVSEDGGTLVPLSVTLTAVPLELSPAEWVELLIDAIGEVTLDSGDAIEAAREAYDALTNEQKEDVYNYQVLLTAESEYAALNAQEAAGDAQEAADAAQEAADDAAKKAAEAKTYAEDADAKAKAAQTSADQAKTMAEAAQKAAQDAAGAAGDASDAQTAAEAARDKAVEAQKQADAAAANAKTAWDNAQLAEDNAKAAQTAAENAAKAAKDNNTEAAAQALEAAKQAGLAAEQYAKAAEQAGCSAASAAASAKSAEESASFASVAADAAKKALIAQQAAEDAQAKAEAAQKASLAIAKYQAALSVDTYAGMVDQSDYLAEQIEALANIVSAAKVAIAAAESTDEIQKALDEAKAAIGAIGDMCPSKNYTDVAGDAWYHDAVDYMIANGYMKGVSDTLFDVQGSVTRGQLVTILYRVAGEPSVEGLVNPFQDVANDTWYTDAVIWAASEGIVKGVSETEFAPNAKITREQIVTILYRYDGEKAVSEDKLAAFTDAASVGSYAVDAMNWAIANGIVNGMTETTLAPTATATRAQMAVILKRFMTE